MVGATPVGKTMFAKLIKMIHRAGSIVKSLVSAGTAATVTTALGEVYIAVMVASCNGEMKIYDLETKKGRAKFRRLFTEALHNYKQKNV